MNEIKIYTVDEAADILKVSKRTVYSYIKSGKIQAAKIGKYWRIPEGRLKEFIFTGATETGSTAKAK